MADNKPKPSQNFVMNNEAPRFSTRILATGNQNFVVFSFGTENPSKPTEAHMHTRIALPLETVKQMKGMLDKITNDLELKKTIGNLNYDQIPSDS